MTGYAETYRRSREQPEEFWAEAAEAIAWERRWERVLEAATRRSTAGSPARALTRAGTRSTAMSRRDAASGSR